MAQFEHPERAEDYDPTAPFDRETGNDQTRTSQPRREDDRVQGEQSTQQQAQQAVDTAKAKGQQMMDRAQQTADTQRQQTADRLGDAADTLRQNKEQLPGGEMTQRAATTAAEKMDQASGYLQQHDVGDMMSDLQQFARAHPTESLIGAVVVGFMVGRMLRS